MSVPHPTVLLATRNRAATLASVLEQYCRLQSPPNGWDMIVVDNGSSDRTAEVVRSFSRRLPVQYVSEPTPGKNAALNAGLRFVTGDLVVFTDDDIFPNADWLVELCAAAESHESYAVFAGVIRPRWEAPPSEVILQALPLGVAYAIHPPGLREGPTAASFVFGGNVAIRADVFRNGYRFDPAMGPRPTAVYVMGGESELIRRLDAEARGIWCCDKAIVEHLVPRSNLETAWILRRAERYGRAQYRLGDGLSNGPTWLGVPRWIYRAVLTESFSIARAAVARNSVKLLQTRWQLHLFMGISAEARATRRSGADGRQAVLIREPKLSHRDVA